MTTGFKEQEKHLSSAERMPRAPRLLLCLWGESDLGDSGEALVKAESVAMNLRSPLANCLLLFSRQTALIGSHRSSWLKATLERFSPAAPRKALQHAGHPGFIWVLCPVCKQSAGWFQFIGVSFTLGKDMEVRTRDQQDSQVHCLLLSVVGVG